MLRQPPSTALHLLASTIQRTNLFPHQSQVHIRSKRGVVYQGAFSVFVYKKTSLLFFFSFAQSPAWQKAVIITYSIVWKLACTRAAISASGNVYITSPDSVTYSATTSAGVFVAKLVDALAAFGHYVSG